MCLKETIKRLLVIQHLTRRRFLNYHHHLLYAINNILHLWEEIFTMNNVTETECNTMSDSHILFKSIPEGELEKWITQKNIKLKRDGKLLTNKKEMKKNQVYSLLLHKHQRRVESCVHLMYVVMASFLLLTWEIWIETLVLQRAVLLLDICYPRRW